MKSLKLRVGLLCLATFLTLGLSHRVALAACASVEAGGNVYGDYDCRLVDSCGGWCYYECTCSNLFPGKTCDDVLHEAGFEPVDNIPCQN
jgi:hypothetical protein